MIKEYWLCEQKLRVIYGLQISYRDEPMNGEEFKKSVCKAHCLVYRHLFILIVFTKNRLLRQSLPDHNMEAPFGNKQG
jgi:hypothetical protein